MRLKMDNQPVIEARMTVTSKGEVTGDAASAAVDQCLADAVQGSFGQYPHWWDGALGIQARIIRGPYVDLALSSRDKKIVDFSFAMPNNFFPRGAGALQHLVGILVGDLFSTTLGEYSIRAEVKSVELGTEITTDHERLFRGRSYTIHRIRQAFNLTEGEPLLAYSFKPRCGVPFERLRDAALSVCRSGFQIVELDTRNLEVSHDNIDQWISLAKTIAGLGKGPDAKVFSPNLSRASFESVELASEWTTKLRDTKFTVIKIDGGLDGLSATQAVRAKADPLRQPIITCYPLLRGVLPEALRREWPYYMALSGADIIYPGGRPSFPSEPRPIWADEAKNLRSASSHYDAHIKRGWPMPTAAGGIHPGQLHVFYELLGPNVAYFLGGAVALHRDGPAKGALLCRKVLDAARASVKKAADRGDAYSNPVPTKLVRELETSGYPHDVTYINPETVFAETDEVPYPPKPFYRRWR